MKPLTPAQIAARAIECRQIRLFLAKNPGSTSLEIFNGTGIRNAQSRLFKMIGMGIVTMEIKKGDDGRARQRWSVVPQ